MSDAPEQIWAAEPSGSGCVIGFVTPSLNYKAPYILATPATLSSHPEVMKMVAEAEARGMERALGIMKTAGDSAVTEAMGQRLCCNGQDCGCHGATVEQYLEHLICAEAAAIRKGETT